MPAAAPCVRVAPQRDCSAGTGAVGLALNPLPRKRFPTGDQIRFDGATTTAPSVNSVSNFRESGMTTAHQRFWEIVQLLSVCCPWPLTATGRSR